MILRTLVADPWRPRDTRETEWLPTTGGSLRDYLPAECLAPDTDPALFTVSHNGRVLGAAAWGAVIPRDGDGIVVSLRPLGLEVAVIAIVAQVISFAIAWNENKRAKIQAHHAARRAAAQAEQMGDSMIYGWHGAQNTTEPGRPIPVLYGRHRVGGHVVFAETRLGLSAGQAALDMVLVISEGEVQEMEGLTTTVEINGKPITAYPGVSATARTGTTIQSMIPSGWSGATPSATQAMAVTLVLGTPVVVVTAANVDGYEVKIESPAGVNPSGLAITGAAPGGGVTTPGGTARYEVRVRHRINGSGAPFTLAGTLKSGPILCPASIAGSGPTSQTFKLGTLLTPGMYDVEVTLMVWTAIVPSPYVFTGFYGSSRVELTALRSFREFGPRFPGLAILGFSALPSASLSGALPNVTSVWKGRKVGIWNDDTPPTFTDTYTQNPAWCALDVLRNRNYGAGQHFSAADDVDLPSVRDAANFCDTLVTRGLANPLKSGSGTGSTSGSIFTASGSPAFTDGTIRAEDTLRILGGADAGDYRISAIDSAATLAVTSKTPPFPNITFAGSSGVSWQILNTERRAKCDHYFDGTTNVWQALEAIATNASFAVVRTNGKIKFVPETARAITQIFGMGNVRNYSHQYLGGTKANVFEGQYLDELRNWEQQVESVEDFEVSAGQQAISKTPLSFFGMTRRTQVQRALRRQMLSNRLRDQLIEFETDAAAIAVEFGDTIAFTHDVMPRKNAYASAEPLESGRVLAGSTSTNIKLDRAVTWTANNRRLRVQSLADDVIRTPRSEEADGTISDFPLVSGLGGYTPVEGDVWVAEPEFIDSPPPHQWEVIGLSRTQDGQTRVQAMIYRPEMFDVFVGVDAIQPPE